MSADSEFGVNLQWNMPVCFNEADPTKSKQGSTLSLQIDHLDIRILDAITEMIRSKRNTKFSKETGIGKVITSGSGCSYPDEHTVWVYPLAMTYLCVQYLLHILYAAITH